MTLRNALAIGLVTCLCAGSVVAQSGDCERHCREASKKAEERALAEPYRGVLANGEPVYGLFPAGADGASTEPVVAAAEAFLSSLSSDQRSRIAFPVDAEEWRKWMSRSCYLRQGVSLAEMDESQREAALNLLRASLSPKGFALVRGILRANRVPQDPDDSECGETGEWRYRITLMGEPSATKPWGWQLDGHQAIVNYFVLGDQVVMSPLYFGSVVPATGSADSAKADVLKAEERGGLAMVRGLSEAQRQMAVIERPEGKTNGSNIVAGAFHDNVNLEISGIPGALLDTNERSELLALVELYVGTLREPHARIKMEQVKAHLEQTYFAWSGGTRPRAAFYYRVFSPVILIEFERRPAAEGGAQVRAVVRTPNGNDYGKSLLQQYSATHP